MTEFYANNKNYKLWNLYQYGETTSILRVKVVNKTIF
jgi:hypothetical protein